MCQSICMKYCCEGPSCKDVCKHFHSLINNDCRKKKPNSRKDFSILSCCVLSKSALKVSMEESGIRFYFICLKILYI